MQAEDDAMIPSVKYKTYSDEVWYMGSTVKVFAEF
jgi:hypothetical protein